MHKKLLQLPFFFLTIIFLFSCNVSDAKKPQKKERMTWVYLEAQTITQKDTTANYIYGKVKERLVNNLDNKKGKEIFKVTDIRYFNNDDLFQLYKDDNEAGILFFKVESIQKISVYSRDPIYSFDKEDLHQSTLEIIE